MLMRDGAIKPAIATPKTITDTPSSRVGSDTPGTSNLVAQAQTYNPNKMLNAAPTLLGDISPEWRSIDFRRSCAVDR